MKTGRGTRSNPPKPRVGRTSSKPKNRKAAPACATYEASSIAMPKPRARKGGNGAPA